jgi:hypothetical protein
VSWAASAVHYFCGLVWGGKSGVGVCKKKREREKLFCCKVVEGRVFMVHESIHMLICRQTTEPNALSSLRKQGSLCVIWSGWSGRPVSNHLSSPAPKFGQTEYSRSDSRKLGSLDEERRR